MNHVIFKAFLVILFTGNVFITYAQCPTNNIILSTQQDIDDFSNNYPGCNEIMGNVTIQEAVSGNILNLNGLSQINTVNGDLIIASNESLLNLEGLSNLNNLQGGFLIFENNSLNSLSGLENLTTIGSGSSVAFYFAQNINISNLDALSNLESVNGSLTIKSSWLTNLNGLVNVQNIYGNIDIGLNFRLTDIEGLRNINPLNINLFAITQNHVLSNCAIQSLCNYFDQIPSSINIQNNAAGCNYINEVRDACALGIKDQQLSEVKVYPNPTNDTFEISGLIEGILEIIDSQGRIVKQMDLNKGTHSISELSTGVYFVKITSENSSITKRLIKM